MGIIRKQATASTLFSYLGVALGYINVIILFPAFFSSEQFGLIQLLISSSEIFSVLSALGLYNSITRFFPFFKSEDKSHNGFLSIIFIISTAGFLFTTVLYLIFRPYIVIAFSEKSSLFLNYFYLVIPLALFIAYFGISEAIARTIYKTRFATFLREVGLRLFNTIGIVLFIFKIFDFDGFVIYFVFFYGLNALLMLLQVIISHEYSIKISLKNVNFIKFFEILKYGGYTLVSGAAMVLGLRMPTLLIGSMIGLSIVGAYNLYFYVASIIYIPMRALSKISIPIFATAFKENNLKEIVNIYKRTSLIQLIIGGLIFVGVIVNKHNLFYFIRKPEYIDNFGIFILLGIGILIEVSVGLSSDIIVNSPKFRFDSLFNGILFVSTIVFNIIFINLFGGIGAGVAAVVSLFIFIFLKWLFLMKTYRMQPLGYKQLIVIAVAAVSYFAGSALPFVLNVFADIAVRSLLTTVIYGGLIIGLKISEDINERFNVYKKMIFG